jgi:hypothetical protein
MKKNDDYACHNCRRLYFTPKLQLILNNELVYNLILIHILVSIYDNINFKAILSLK